MRPQSDVGHPQYGILTRMPHRSPTLEGFRAMFRRPSLGLAELAWRWSFGTATALLLLYCFREYLDTLPVSRGELFFLRSRQPVLVSQALAQIFRGSAPRLVESLIVMALALAAAWIVLSSLGRVAILQAILGYFRESVPPEIEPTSKTPAKISFYLHPLLGLNFFRVASALAATVGVVGAMILAGRASPASDPSPGAAMLLFLTLFMLIWIAWSSVNWFLSLASIFAAQDGRDTFGAIVEAADLCRARAGAVTAAGTWFGLAHVIAFFVAGSVVAFPVAFARVLPAGVVLGGVLLVLLLYCFVVDFLYVGRLAAYVAITQWPEPPLVPEITAPISGPTPDLDILPTADIDRDESILSELPLTTSH